jgi:hypothetical protein
MVETDRGWSIWPQQLPELPRVTNAEYQSLSLIWNSSQREWLSIASPWREGTPAGLGELRHPQALSPTDRFLFDTVALGSARAIDEWRNGGTITGLKIWPGHLVESLGMGMAILTLACLVWWFSSLWNFLQTRKSLTLVMVGLLWWGWFVGGGWGFTLAAISLPGALWDLRIARNRPVRAHN